MDSTPITTRQLESLIRLAEARAKAELREEVTEEDAQDVVELFQAAMFDTLLDEGGPVDFTRTSGMSKQKDAQMFIKELSRVAESTACSVFSRHELSSLAKSLNIQSLDFDTFVDMLNTQGFLLKRGPGVYKLATMSAYSQRSANFRREGSTGIF